MKSLRLKLILTCSMVALISFGVTIFFIDRDLEVRNTILTGLIFSLIAAFITGSILASRITGPIKKMIDASRRFSTGDLGYRILRYPKDELGELAMTLNAMARVLENKMKEAESQNQKLAAIFSGMIEGVIVVDGSARIVSMNPAVEKLFGVTSRETEGRLFLESIRNNDINNIICMALKNGRTASGELDLVHPVRKIFQINATPIFANDSINGALVVIHDITELKRLEKVRSDFVANVSHELKTPLTSIKGFAETLLDGALDDRENNRNFIKIIETHATRLNSLVDDLLSLSRLESDAISLHREKFELKNEIEQIILGFGSQLAEKNVNIYYDLLPQLSITADRQRICQVLTNLIDNAIKFNKPGGSVKILGETADGAIRITVEDTGAGIPEKDLTRVFERFYRVDKARSRDLGGTGLGLSIVRHIVELHGGTVGVDSTEGLGSRFWFTIPA